jgi:hypothetical protein
MRLASGNKDRRFAGDVDPIPGASALNPRVVFIESPNSWNRALSPRALLRYWSTVQTNTEGQVGGIRGRERLQAPA